jgi:hypothetical protein
MLSGGPLENLVMGYPFEDVLCLFELQEVKPTAFEQTRKYGGSYYRYIWRAWNETPLQTALDLAVLFDKIHVHPIDLPIYDLKSFIEPSKHRDSGVSALVGMARAADERDETYQSLLAGFGDEKGFVDQRVVWHLADSHRLNAPIAVSDSLMDLYAYRLSTGFTSLNKPVEVARRAIILDKAVDDELGVSFKIGTWDDLLTLRRDGDIGAYRKRIAELLEVDPVPSALAQIRADVKDAMVKVEEIRAFRKRGRLQTFLSPLAKLADILAHGVPLASWADTGLAASREIKVMRLEKATRWLLFKMTPPAQKRVRQGQSPKP